MTQKLTILDIAKLAGVGKSTVSRVLTNDPKVKPATREKVEQVIRESGYVPSKSAQAMRGGSAKVVGVILSRLDSPSENKAVSGILDVIYQAGYDAVIMESQFSAEKTNEHLEVLTRRNVDGVIVFGFSGCDMSAIETFGHRAVVIAVDTDQVSSVDYDHKGLIELAVNKLVEQGLEAISYIGVDESDRTTGLMRLNAYKECCERLGISPCFQTGQLSYESAYHLTDKVLLAETQAIVCASDTLAMGVAKRLQELGRTDVQVSGVGATSLLSFLFPNTFSIDPGYYQAGAESARLLIRQLSEPAGITHLVQQASV
ncbi:MULTISPECIES: trehalose operon repressor TreR [Photobacterium]|uniref:Trehalose repressor n=1 Tax=Photobacterium ganghwense TaxID=320778 RepID=A0A0J1KAW8_9GAMM|nr:MULTISPECIES: trehalose operon repressor TreR [Photobacterium]KLV11467.1 trehalose repressor [Photobacterium ganghwense]MBV1841740.1 trehalose operon repressor TreR [Photobacterium ganghwense]PSU08322.1 trehalose operon repressor [Photobacterium ganghwense]QSV15129.1 trehalose operon repressor [Photobacterium ganghwense]